MLGLYGPTGCPLGASENLKTEQGFRLRDLLLYSLRGLCRRYLLHLISPSTTVAIAPPWNVLPSNGEFLLRDAD